MGLNSMGFGFIFSARDLASGEFNKLQRSYQNLDQATAAGTTKILANWSKLKIGLGAVGIGAGALMGAFAFAKPSGEFEYELARVGAISRATAGDMDVLREAAVRAGLETQFSPLESAKALSGFASKGFNAAESATALRSALDLAAGGQIDAASATQAMTSALKVFSLDASEAGLAADKLLRISNVSALMPEELSLALGTVGRGAIMAKQSMDEMLPSIGLVRNTGLEASVAASATSAAMMQMAKNAKKFKQLGVDVADAEGNFRPFLDVVQDVKGKLGGMGDVKAGDFAQRLFGRYGVAAYSAITAQLEHGVRGANGEILKGTKAVEFLRTSMKNAGGTTKEFIDRLLDTYEGQRKILGGVFSTLAIEIGKPLIEVLKPVVKAISTVVVGLINLIKAIPSPIKRAAAGLFLFISAVTVVAGAVLAVSGAIGMLMPAITAVAGVVATAMAPFVFVGVLLAQVGAAVYGLSRILTTEFSSIGGFFGRVWSKIKLFFNGLTQLFTDGFFSGAVMREISTAENEGLMGFVIALFRIGSRIREVWRGLWGGMMEVLSPMVEEFQVVFRELWAELEGVFDELAGAFGEVGAALADVLPVGTKFHGMGALIGVTIGAVIRVLGTLLIWAVKVFVGIAKAIKHVIGFFREVVAHVRTLPESFKTTWAVVKPILEKVRDFGISVAEKIGDAFSSMADAIKSSLVSLQDLLIKAVRKIPDWALPEKLEYVKTLKTSEEETDARNREAFRNLPYIDKAATRVAMRQGADPGEVVEAIKKWAIMVTDTPIVVTLDGEKVGKAIRGGQADADRRAFRPVRVTQ